MPTIPTFVINVITGQGTTTSVKYFVSANAIGRGSAVSVLHLIMDFLSKS